MRGHLHLTASPNGGGGGTFLSRQSFRAPLHISKPHAEAGALVVNMVNPTAGLFEGDEVDCEVCVESGAALVLTTPSSSRIYRARGTGEAVLRQSYSVEAGGFLEFFPELLIPQAGARYRQETRLSAAPGGQLLYFEWLAPGRVAGGEVFEYDELAFSTDLRVGGRLAGREQYTLSPATDSLEALKRAHPAAHYLSCYFLGELACPYDLVESQNNSESFLGCTPLALGGWTIKALCPDGPSTRRLMLALRAGLYSLLDRPVPWLGRF